MALSKELLQEDGDKFLLSAKFNQDAIEQYFSKQRAVGGGNENPDARIFGYNHLKLLVAGSSSVRAAARGNITVTSNDEPSVADVPLPRRQKPKNPT